MTVARDAAVLYIASRGWGADLRCAHVFDPDAGGLEDCGRPMAGISADDASPLCEEHLTHHEEEGHRLEPETLEAIRVERERLLRENLEPHGQSRLKR